MTQLLINPDSILYIAVPYNVYKIVHSDKSIGGFYTGAYIVGDEVKKCFFDENGKIPDSNNYIFSDIYLSMYKSKNYCRKVYHYPDIKTEEETKFFEKHGRFYYNAKVINLVANNSEHPVLVRIEKFGDVYFDKTRKSKDKKLSLI